MRGYREALRFACSLSDVDFPQGSIIFAGGWSDLVHFILSRHIRKLGSQNSRLLVSIQALIGADLENRLELDFRETIRKSMYTIPLVGGITKSYREPITKVNLWNRFPRPFDVLINIQHSAPANGTLVFNNLSFPPSLLSPGEIKRQKPTTLENNALLVLLDSTLTGYGMCNEEQYWQGANELIEFLRNLCSNCKIYIKLHPLSDDQYVARINDSEVTVINKNISAEEVYLMNLHRIRGVFSSSSTSLITARWFGIPSYDCSEVLGLNARYLENFKAYFKHAGGIVRVRRMSDLQSYENSLTSENAEVRSSHTLADAAREEWSSLIRSLNDLVKY